LTRLGRCEEKSYGSDSKARMIHALGLEIYIGFTRYSRALYTIRKYESTIQGVVLWRCALGPN